VLNAERVRVRIAEHAPAGLPGSDQQIARLPGCIDTTDATDVPDPAL
jgi:hypothetical protein